ncbi:RNA polymerase sigma-70 factor, ECF subfamily [Mesonia phycicola]|uniref:RNA polymerase sigma-70 factor, ECF subfamily n=1 Tax=Mesonia phycicola TaxID=579105 RepID=A0A1M6GQX0_9FLAO|nr:RNA polymerase sigma factor [Mesonia phycicola]SHJ12364.1 RNA polymerase sigma-70 factor, ECF subfamily [Mesonia phycicola]
MKVIQLHTNQKRLIKKAQKKDRKAQQSLYEAYAPKMLSVCRMYIKDLQFAEDVMLKGFMKVFTHLSSYKSEGSFEGWIRKIMVREAIDFLRSHKKIQFSETLENDAVFTTDNSFQSNDAVEFLQQKIDELPEGYKAVFMLYAVEGYKHQEIAKMLKITVGTSKSQLSKARKVLQQKVEPQRKENHAGR